MAKFNKVQKKRTLNGIHVKQKKTGANEYKKEKIIGGDTQNGDQDSAIVVKTSDSTTQKEEEVDFSQADSSETLNGDSKTQNGAIENHSKGKKTNKKKCKWRENLKKKKMRASGVIPVSNSPTKRALEDDHEASGPAKRKKVENGIEMENGTSADSSASKPKEPAKMGKQYSSNWMQLKMVRS